MSIVHLSVQSDNSLMEGYGLITEYIELAKKYNQTALALTDHNSMVGIYKFIQACKKNGIKPIPGVTLNIAPVDVNGNVVKDTVHYGFGINPVWKGAITKVRLLAKNKDGLINLFKLVKLSYSPDNVYLYPRVTLEQLAEHSSNIICLTGDRFGEVACRVRAGEMDKARESLANLKAIFHDDLYVELIPIVGPDLESVSKLALLAKEVGVSPVVTNDVFYPNKEDSFVHENILAMGNKARMQERAIDEGGTRFRYTDSERYLKSTEELVEYLRSTVFPNIRDIDGITKGEIETSIKNGLKNTVVISKKVNDIEMEYNSHIRPPVIIPEAFQTPLDYIKYLITKGFKEKRGNAPKDVQEESKRRVREELDVIYGNDFVDYFITVKDVIDWARSQGQEVGVGRGSVGGSEVAYLLDISRTDPIRFELMFERFISPGRGATYQITYEDGTVETLNVAEKRKVNGKEVHAYQLNKGDLVEC